MALAHGVCVAVEEAGPSGWPQGRDARRAAVSMASLIGEALLESQGPSVAVRLKEAAERLAEVKGLLDTEGFLTAVPEADRTGVLCDLALLEEDLSMAMARSSAS